MLASSASKGAGGCLPGALCENCGEPTHVYFCPKPPDIPADIWRGMSQDERLEAERRSVPAFTAEMTGGDVRVEFHPTPPEPHARGLRRVVLCRAGVQVARDWFTIITRPPSAGDAAYYIEKHIAAPVARKGLPCGDPRQRAASRNAGCSSDHGPASGRRVK